MVSVCLPSDALSQHLPSYLGFSYLGRGVSLHGRPSWPWTWGSSPRPLLCHRSLALSVAAPDLGRRVDQWRNNSKKNEGMAPKQKQYPVIDVTGDRSKVRCCKEQYCIGTWNVRFMNQGKLEVVKQEMARVNVDIIGISELKWTGMGEFNSDDHCIYY